MYRGQWNRVRVLARSSWTNRAPEAAPGTGSADDYTRKLEPIEKRSTQSDPAFRRGEITHMRCSPKGQWVVVCHKHTCIVYDLQNDLKCVTLQADNKYSAEHAEWHPTGPMLLTRTEKEIRLWKMPDQFPDPGDSDSELTCQTRYIFDDGRQRCNYIKWLDDKEFLLLTNQHAIHRIDISLGTLEVIQFAQDSDVKDKYHISQVYPIKANKIDKVICLATKIAKFSDSESAVQPNADGVDYFLYLARTENETSPALWHNIAEIIGKLERIILTLDRSRDMLRGIYDRFRGILRRNSAAADYPAEVLAEVEAAMAAATRIKYKIRHRKILPRNVRNMKFRQDHRFMLINFLKNELGTTAPELWPLDVDADPCSLNFQPYGSIMELPAETSQTHASAEDRWGEASFAGPSHDIIVCEVDGVMSFYHLKDQKLEFNLEKLNSPFKKPDFEEFSRPIFAWGDTLSYPLLVATDWYGAGNVHVWSGEEASQLQGNPGPQEPAPNPDEHRDDVPQHNVGPPQDPTTATAANNSNSKLPSDKTHEEIQEVEIPLPQDTEDQADSISE